MRNFDLPSPAVTSSAVMYMRSLRLLLAGLVVSTSAFSVTPVPSSATRAQRTSAVAPAVALAPRRPTHSVSRIAPVQMGLFGLGWPEIGVIGVITIFFFGPDKLLALAKDAGKATAGLKEVSAEALEEFKEVSAETAKDLKEASGPALKEFKDAATPVLSDLKDTALKEVKEVAVSFTEGAKEAEVPTGSKALEGTDSKAPEEKAVKA